MTEFSESAANWGLHTAVAGVVVFALGWAWVRRVSDPARRRQLAAWVVRGGVLAAVLCLFPAWLVLPNPRWAEPKPVTVAALPVKPSVAQEKPIAATQPPAVRWQWVAPTKTPEAPIEAAVP